MQSPPWCAHGVSLWIPDAEDVWCCGWGSQSWHVLWHLWPCDTLWPTVTIVHRCHHASGSNSVRKRRNPTAWEYRAGTETRNECWTCSGQLCREQCDLDIQETFKLPGPSVPFKYLKTETCNCPAGSTKTRHGPNGPSGPSWSTHRETKPYSLTVPRACWKTWLTWECKPVCTGEIWRVFTPRIPGRKIIQIAIWEQNFFMYFLGSTHQNCETERLVYWVQCAPNDLRDPDIILPVFRSF